MGWGRMLLLGDWGNQMDIQDTRSMVDDLQDRLRPQRRIDWAQSQQIGELERENRELKLYLASLARLLVRNGVITEADLAACVSSVEGTAATARDANE